MSYRVWLLEELSRRKRRNPAYSLTAFSKSLGLSAPTLSQVIAGKRPLSRRAAMLIAERCALPPQECRRFLMSALGPQTNLAGENVEYRELEVEIFKLVADWRHYAILSLGKVKPNRASPSWISERLGIPVTEAEEAFDRLLRLKLLERRGTGFSQSGAPFCMPAGHNSDGAVRAHQRQVLQKAQEALEDPSVPLHHFSSITMAVDEKALAGARETIRKFRRELCSDLERGEPTRVYTLSVQLVPNSKA